MTQKPSTKVFVVAGLLAGSVSAVVGYAIMYLAAAFLGYDDSALKPSEKTPHEVATSYALIAGFYGLVLGVLLIFGKRPWASSLFALIPFTWALVILMLTGRFRDLAVLATFAITVGLISRSAANFSLARLK